jgi:hypothetical protein
MYALHKGTAQSMIFLVENFRHFEKQFWQMNVLSKISLLKFKKCKKEPRTPKVATVACCTKGCLSFSYFHILNIVKIG